MSAFVFPPTRSGLTPLTEAQAVVDGLAAQLATQRERAPGPIRHVPLHEALGRKLAHDLIAPLDLPRADNAAMDGYAFARADVQANPTRLPIAHQVLAGAQAQALAPMSCVRIMTGARLPARADAVLPLEEASIEGDTLVLTPEQATRATHVRRRGEELAAGSVALPAGTWLTPAALGLAAQLGLAELPVTPRLRVAVVSCGDELKNPGDAHEVVAQAHVAQEAVTQFDGNRALLMACVQQLGCEAIDGGIARDSLDATRAQFTAALQSADVLITTGGAGGGDADFARAALHAIVAQTPHASAWHTSLALKPGKPFGLAHLGTQMAIALPGNPVAALVAFEALASRALRILQGLPAEDASREIAATLTHTPKTHANRTEYLRAHLRWVNGEWQATVLSNQSSSMLSPQLQANGWVVASPGASYRFLLNMSANFGAF